MSQQAANSYRLVKPILSLDSHESRQRALSLYKACYRQLPFIVRHFDIPKSVSQCRAKLREEFKKHECETDLRVIDMLIIKGQMRLAEIVNNWQQPTHIMTMFKPTHEPKPKDFLPKFILGIE